MIKLVIVDSDTCNEKAKIIFQSQPIHDISEFEQYSSIKEFKGPANLTGKSVMLYDNDGPILCGTLNEKMSEDEEMEIVETSEEPEFKKFKAQVKRHLYIEGKLCLDKSCEENEWFININNEQFNAHLVKVILPYKNEYTYYNIKPIIPISDDSHKIINQYWVEQNGQINVAKKQLHKK